MSYLSTVTKLFYHQHLQSLSRPQLGEWDNMLGVVQQGYCKGKHFLHPISPNVSGRVVVEEFSTLTDWSWTLYTSAEKMYGDKFLCIREFFFFKKKCFFNTSQYYFIWYFFISDLALFPLSFFLVPQEYGGIVFWFFFIFTYFKRCSFIIILLFKTNQWENEYKLWAEIWKHTVVMQILSTM